MRHFVIHDSAESSADFNGCDHAVHDVSIATKQRYRVQCEEDRDQPDSFGVWLLLVIDELSHILNEVGVQQCTRLRYDRHNGNVSKFALEHMEQAIAAVNVHTFVRVALARALYRSLVISDVPFDLSRLNTHVFHGVERQLPELADGRHYRISIKEKPTAHSASRSVVSLVSVLLRKGRNFIAFNWGHGACLVCNCLF